MLIENTVYSGNTSRSDIPCHCPVIDKLRRSDLLSHSISIIGVFFQGRFVQQSAHRNTVNDALALYKYLPSNSNTCSSLTKYAFTTNSQHSYHRQLEHTLIHTSIDGPYGRLVWGTDKQIWVCLLLRLFTVWARPLHIQKVPSSILVKTCSGTKPSDTGPCPDHNRNPTGAWTVFLATAVTVLLKCAPLINSFISLHV